MFKCYLSIRSENLVVEIELTDRSVSVRRQWVEPIASSVHLLVLVCIHTKLLALAVYILLSDDRTLTL